MRPHLAVTAHLAARVPSTAALAQHDPVESTLESIGIHLVPDSTLQAREAME